MWRGDDYGDGEVAVLEGGCAQESHEHVLVLVLVLVLVSVLLLST